MQSEGVDDDDDDDENEVEDFKNIDAAAGGSATENYINPSNPMPVVKSGNRIEYIDKNGASNNMTVINRAGKVGGKYGHCYNIQNQQGEGTCIDLLRDFHKWRKVPDSKEILSCSLSDREYQAKLAEHDNWVSNNVYVKVNDCGQSTISLRWVVTEKMKNNVPVVKAHLVARGFEEDLFHRTDSPTCSKDSLMLSLALMASYGWQSHSIDIKCAFLQGKEIECNVYMRPPKEFDDGYLWKLNKNVYGLNDAARAWYSKLKYVLMNLGMQISQLDPALFFWWRGNVLSGIMCVHVDDILLGGTSDFFANIVAPMKEQLTVGTSHDGEFFKYIGVNITQKDGIIGLHQNDYVDSLEKIGLTRAHASRRLDKLGKRELHDYRALVGQINWLGTQTRSDISFDVCELSAVLNAATVDDVLRVKK